MDALSRESVLDATTTNTTPTPRRFSCLTAWVQCIMVDIIVSDDYTETSQQNEKGAIVEDRVNSERRETQPTSWPSAADLCAVHAVILCGLRVKMLIMPPFTQLGSTCLLFSRLPVIFCLSLFKLLIKQNQLHQKLYQKIRKKKKKKKTTNGSTTVAAKIFSNPQYKHRQCAYVCVCVFCWQWVLLDFSLLASCLQWLCSSLRVSHPLLKLIGTGLTLFLLLLSSVHLFILIWMQHEQDAMRLSGVWPLNAGAARMWSELEYLKILTSI